MILLSANRAIFARSIHCLVPISFEFCFLISFNCTAKSGYEKFLVFSIKPPFMEGKQQRVNDETMWDYFIITPSYTSREGRTDRNLSFQCCFGRRRRRRGCRLHCFLCISGLLLWSVFIVLVRFGGCLVDRFRLEMELLSSWSPSKCCSQYPLRSPQRHNIRG